jgi:preprotein translocase subunit SecB
MNVTKNVPLSGFSILKVYAVEMSLHAEDAENLPAGTLDVNFGWDWRYVSADTFEVKISVALKPEKSRPFSVSTTLVGVFRKVGDSSKLSLQEFTKLQAVAILLPYARQYLANLTVNTVTGAYNLPTVNVVGLMANFDISKTTGASQEKDGQIPIDRPVKTSKLAKTERGKTSPIRS